MSFNKIKRNPIVILASICILCAIFFNPADKVAFGYLQLSLVIICPVAFFFSLYAFKKKEVCQYRFSIIKYSFVTGIAFLFTVFFISILKQYAPKNIDVLTIAFLFLGIFIIGIFAYTVRLWRKGLISDNHMVLFIILIGFLLRLMYILFINIHTTQNDEGSFEKQFGHLGYIGYLYTYCHIPDFDPRQAYQFWHPPLHYILCALWLKLNTICGAGIDRALENLQILTLFYSGCILIFFDKILVKLKIKSYARICMNFVVAFMPYLVSMAGATNNDELCLLLMLISIYYLLIWYEKPNFPNIIKIAVFLGLAIMTKLSGAIIAPAIAVVFLIKLVEKRKKWLYYMGQFAVFGSISIPLGLWYYLRNNILFGVPITYVFRISDKSAQFISNYSIWQRLFGITPAQLSHLSISWSNQDIHFDYTIPLSLLKFITFNESDYCSKNILATYIGGILFYLIAIIAISLIVLAVFGLIKGELNWKLKLFPGVLFLTVMGQYIKFCFDFPHVCSMNVRYILIALLMLYILSGTGYMAVEKKGGIYKKIARILFYVLLVQAVFCCLSILMCLIVS